MVQVTDTIKNPDGFYFRIGDLRHRVVIQLRADTPTGAFNETRPAWSVLATRWARVSLATGAESDFGPGAEQRRHGFVIMRAFAGLDAKQHRLVYRGRVLNIAGVVDMDERRIAMYVPVIEQVGEA